MKIKKTNTWICPKCGLINSNNLSACSNCHYIHNSVSNCRLVKKRLWLCKTCGTKNNGSHCIKCGRLKNNIL